MSLFSSRKGLIEPSPKGRAGELSKSLRVALWNDFYEIYRSHVTTYGVQRLSEPIANLLRRIWSEYLGQPADDYPGHGKMIDEIKDLFLSSEWFIPLDFFEIVHGAAYPLAINRLGFEQHINGRLNAENAAYSFVEGKFIDRVSDVEKAAIEDAAKLGSDPVRKHFEEARRLLSDRHGRGYANSVKESILAVEAACQQLFGKNKGTLSAILKTVDGAQSIHPALRDAFIKLYGWTGDGGGIRHAIADDDNPPTREEAHFMLVACSAFVNYLFAREAE